MEGFKPTFLDGCEVPLPEPHAAIRPALFAGGEPVHHSRLSLIFNAERGFAAVTAHNIDGATVIPEGVIPLKRRFRFDPLVPRELQVDNNQGYRFNPYDRGHLAQRRAFHWGDVDAARQADNESFFWTNIAPQHENLNGTPWARIESWMLDVADDADKRASVFTGPVFTPTDPELVNLPGESPFRLPAGFWKVIAVKHGGRLRAAAFLAWQRDFARPEPLPFDPVLEQVRLTTIEFLTGLGFPALAEADPLRFDERLADASGTPNRPVCVMEPTDICL